VRRRSGHAEEAELCLWQGQQLAALRCATGVSDRYCGEQGPITLRCTKRITWDYVVVEVSKDASSWTVLRMMSPDSGMGLCKKE